MPMYDNAVYLPQSCRRPGSLWFNAVRPNFRIPDDTPGIQRARSAQRTISGNLALSSPTSGYPSSYCRNACRGETGWPYSGSAISEPAILICCRDICFTDQGSAEQVGSGPQENEYAST